MGKDAQKGSIMPTVEIATGEVIVLSDRPEVMDLIGQTIPANHANCVEILEQMIVEGNHPVVIVDEKAYRGCDLEALILDLSEFANDRVGGIVVLASDGYEDKLLPTLKQAGANRFVKPDQPVWFIDQMIGEARAERWRERDLHREGVTF